MPGRKIAAGVGDGALSEGRAERGEPPMSKAKAAGPAQGWGSGAVGAGKARLRRLASFADLEAAARRSTPRFAFDFVAGGASDDRAIARSRAALDAIQIVPRYGIDVAGVSMETTLFGRRYRLPLGVAPMGGAGLLWPRADEHLARAAQAAGIPYVLSTVGNAAIERIAELAPDVFWFQLYCAPADGHRMSFDLLRRAEAAGAQALVVTLDIPMPARRLRDIRNGLTIPFKLRGPVLRDIAIRPRWALATLAHGQPRFLNFAPYMAAGASSRALAGFVHESLEGAVTWELLARLRERWPRAFLVKGILHPDDAERAVALGADGVIVSNHGGRQFEAAPAPVDVLPAIAARIGGRALVLADGSMRSGLDVLKALALGASLVFAGRAFLYGVAALGAAGAEHVIDLFAAELRAAMGQIGAPTLAAVAKSCVYHPGALSFEPAPALAATAAQASLDKWRRGAGS